MHTSTCKPVYKSVCLMYGISISYKFLGEVKVFMHEKTKNE